MVGDGVVVVGVAGGLGAVGEDLVGGAEQDGFVEGAGELVVVEGCVGVGVGDGFDGEVGCGVGCGGGGEPLPEVVEAEGSVVLDAGDGLGLAGCAGSGQGAGQGAGQGVLVEVDVDHGSGAEPVQDPGAVVGGVLVEEPAEVHCGLEGELSVAGRSQHHRVRHHRVRHQLLR